jgi:UDP:flavonoid glycosyltransferase YjiC (YdhE family)
MHDGGVRLLFTFVGGGGHAEPLVPVAAAAEAAGHEVAFAGRPAVVAMLATRGFKVFPDEGDPVGPPAEVVPLVEFDLERENRVLREGFAWGHARRRANVVLELCAQWQPDAIVCDEVDFGAMIAAERAGLPHATVLVVAAGSLVQPAVVAAPLDLVRREHGLPRDPELRMLSRHLVVSPMPPGLRDPAFPLPDTAHSIRPGTLEPNEAPEWLDDLADRPTVYFTLGTIFDMESGDLIARVLAGLGELPVNVVATFGRGIDPGSAPANVRIEAHVPHAALLPRCDAVVSHAGSGTVIDTLAAGLPSVLLPIGADQPANAERCEALGAGIVLDPLSATPAEIGAAVWAVLEEPSYRAAAERVRADALALPDARHAVTLIERLVSGGSGGGA